MEGKAPGSQTILVLWTYDIKPQEPAWPPVFQPEYAEVVLRGMAAMIPGLGGKLPEYAPAFLLSRYEDPEYRRILANWDATSGQL